MTSHTNEITHLDIVAEFLEIVIHSVLYVKKLYPNSIFLPRKKYGLAVYQVVHPELREYIKECLTAISFHFKKGDLKKIYICFVNADDRIFEKVVIEILGFNYTSEGDTFLVDLEQCLRDFLLKLYNSQSYLEDLTQDAFFTIQLETSRTCALEFNEDASHEAFPWVEYHGTKGQPADFYSIVPLHTLETHALKLQMYAEK
ncbi:mitotic spindle assembly checkpoint protein MAD2B [Cylas formicarius]|uniref:mitotic spindle assembly checkpoint protein MAD2B n=1 Tax=Cylas formicarius TaxID=197179 RepID=UPI002958D86E|nr:mitotic spindle assembly checkpoint protein MAD2B [Cylas formicarius]